MTNPNVNDGLLNTDAMSEEQIQQYILGLPDLREEVVVIPNWNARFVVRELPGDERSDLLNQCVDIVTGPDGKPKGKTNMQKLYPLLVQKTLRKAIWNEATQTYTGGNLIFPNAILVNAINQKSGAALEIAATASAKLSGLTPEDVQEKKDDLKPMANGASSSNLATDGTSQVVDSYVVLAPAN